MFMKIHDKIMSIQICIVTVVLNILCIILFSCMSNNKSDNISKNINFVVFWVTAFEFKISTLLNLNNNTKHDLKFQYFRCVLVHVHIHVCNNGKSFYGSTIKKTRFLHTLTRIKVHLDYIWNVMIRTNYNLPNCFFIQ